MPKKLSIPLAKIIPAKKKVEKNPEPEPTKTFWHKILPKSFYKLKAALVKRSEDKNRITTRIIEPETNKPEPMTLSEQSKDVVYFQAEYRRNIRQGLVASGAFVLLLVVSSTLIRFSGAVTASGTVMQTGNNKPVQHPLGGAIKEIRVSNGDYVEKGDILLVLDSILVESRLQLLQQQAFELELTIQRLRALQKNDVTFNQVREQFAHLTREHEYSVATQTSLFTAQYQAFQKGEQEIKTRLSGLNKERKALKEQLTTNQKQLKLLDETVADLTDLYDKQLVSKSRLVGAESERMGVVRQIDALKVNQVQNQNSYNDAKQRLATFRQSHQQQLWEQIEAAEKELASIGSQVISASDEFDRLDVRAPVSGNVHEFAFNNTNAVVKPGEVILEIVPASGSMVIETKVNPMDIEQIHTDQIARIRFSTFDAQTTPEIEGRVLQISADSTREEGDDEPFFKVKVSLEEDQVQKITTGDVIPGLPVDTMFTTNQRTLMSYLIKPIKTQFMVAFRE